MTVSRALKTSWPALRLVTVIFALASSVVAREPQRAPVSAPSAKPDSSSGADAPEPVPPTDDTVVDEAAPQPSEDELETQPRVLVALEQARAYYESGRYSDCEQTYDEILHSDAAQDEVGVDAIVDARLFYAACLIAVGKSEDADEQMRAAVLGKPQLSSPDPLVFPGSVIDRYVAIRASLLEELRAREREKVRIAREARKADEERQSQQLARLAQLEEFAAKETIVVQNRRWLAAVPFGVGQFQNGDVGLGWTFLLAEAAFGGTALISAISELGLHSAASESQEPLDKPSFDRQVAVLRTLQFWGTIGFASAAIVGIVEAEISFVPERRVAERQRALPPPPKPTVRPVVAPSTGGVTLGVVGTF